MDIRAYIKSGILQDYSMGILSDDEKTEVERLCAQHPQLQKELDRVTGTLEHYVKENALTPPPALKDTIWSTLQNLEKEKQMDPDNLPLINRFTDHKKWLEFMKPRIPAEITQDEIITPLQSNKSLMQCMVITKADVPNEVHTNELESFIILEGECECTIGDNIIHLTAGGFIEIPLNIPHNVRIISPYVVAILQRVAV